MALIPPHFLNCVVAIGFEDANGDHYYAATGFLYGKRMSVDEPIYNVALVTNRHVFEGKTKAWLRFNRLDNQPAKEFFVELTDPTGIPLWSTQPGIDLAVVAFHANQLQAEGIELAIFKSDKDVLTLQAARDAGVTEGDGVFALGFPMGLVGKERNYVIVRQGAIARIRDAFAKASNDILVDISVFPGNSGGPVIMRPEVTAIQGTKAFSRSMLIGVVASYIPYEDVAVSIQTGHGRIVFQENSGLASVIPVDHVVALHELNLQTWADRGVETIGPVPKGGTV